MEWRRGPYLVSDERERLVLEVIHGYLARSYWAAGIPREVVARSLEHSLCFGLYRVDSDRVDSDSDDSDRHVSDKHGQLPDGAPGAQLGFARVVTDRATFAYLCDVFVLEEARGLGLGKFLIECVHAHPDLQGLRRWLLVTRDAQRLYEPLGWRITPEPEKHMEIVRRDIYRREGRREREG